MKRKIKIRHERQGYLSRECIRVLKHIPWRVAYVSQNAIILENEINTFSLIFGYTFLRKRKVAKVHSLIRKKTWDVHSRIDQEFQVLTISFNNTLVYDFFILLFDRVFIISKDTMFIYGPPLMQIREPPVIKAITKKFKPFKQYLGAVSLSSYTEDETHIYEVHEMLLIGPYNEMHRRLLNRFLFSRFTFET